MQSNGLDLSLIVAYFFVILFIGFYSIKKIENFDDYSVAGRNVPMSLLFATLAATIIGGGATIGRVSLVYETGLIAIIAVLAVVLVHLLSGWFIAPRMRELNRVYTIGDVMGYYYGPIGKGLTTVLSFIYCVGLFGTQILAMGRILEAVTGWGVIQMSVAATIITILYTLAGGMWAVIYTDAIQFIVIVLAVATATLVGYTKIGGMSNIVENIKMLDPQHLSLDAGWSFIIVAGFFLTFFLGEAIAPYYVQRYVSSRNPHDSKWSSLFLGMFFGFFACLIIVIGMITIFVMPDANKDMVFLNYIQQTLPAGLVGLTFGGLLASVMSTSDTILNTAATIFTRDIYNYYINPAAKQETLLKWSRIVTFLVGILGLLITFLIPFVLDLMMFTYNLWAPSIVPPVVIALLWGKTKDRKVVAKAGAPAILTGLFSTIIWTGILGDPYEIPGVLVGIGCNLLMFGVIQSKTSKSAPSL